MCRCSTPRLLVFLQNAALQQSQTLLLKYASTLAREKNVLVQRTLDLTERWNQVQHCIPLPKSGAVIWWFLHMSAFSCNLCHGSFAYVGSYAQVALCMTTEPSSFTVSHVVQNGRCIHCERAPPSPSGLKQCIRQNRHHLVMLDRQLQKTVSCIKASSQI